MKIFCSDFPISLQDMKLGDTIKGLLVLYSVMHLCPKNQIWKETLEASTFQHNREMLIQKPQEKRKGFPIKECGQEIENGVLTFDGNTPLNTKVYI